MNFFSKLHYEKQDLTGKVAIVTGSNIGLGYETAKALAEQNARVYLACRNKEKANFAIEKIKKDTSNNQIFFLSLDLSSFNSVNKCVAAFKEKEEILDILINNAGMISLSKELTEDSFDSTIQPNYLSAVLLTYLLIPSLKKGLSSRIVNVASEAHRISGLDLRVLEKNADTSSISSMSAYGLSKLLLILFSKELANQLQQTNIIVSSTHPGFVDTDIASKESFKSVYIYWLIKPLFKVASWFFARSSEYAAITSLHPAMDPSVIVSGDYYVSCKAVQLDKTVVNSGSLKQLWDKTFEALEISPLV